MNPGPDNESAKYGRALLLVCVLGLGIHAAALADFWMHNPSARMPVADSGVYWRMAGRIAAGRVQDDAPFHAAPLYPYLLGAVRALGGGLLVVYFLQMAARIATALLIARIGRRLSGHGVGVLAAALFLLLGEPVFAATRVLSGTLVLLLTSVVWAQLLRVRESTTPGRCAAAGALLGLVCLAFPPMQLLVLMSAAWVWLLADRGMRRIFSVGALLGCAVLMIAPATLHNWRACGELIPITAHGGVAFRLGYGRGARGVYNPIPGFSRTSEEQPADAAALYERETGGAGTPSRIDRHFFRQGFAEIAREPGRAATLVVRKIYWFLTGRYYNDIFQADFEIRRGYGNRLFLLLLPTAWLMFPALMGLLPSVRHPVRDGPGWMIFFVPLLVVAMFWYSPRYRLPATPVVVISCASVIVSVLRRRTAAKLTGLAATVLAGLLLGAANRAVGFDTPDAEAPALDFNLGLVLLRQERLDEAAESFERVLERVPDDPQAARRLAEIHYNLGVHRLTDGRPAEALVLFERCLDRQPDHFEALNNLAGLLAAGGELESAISLYGRALAGRPNSARVHGNLGKALEDAGRPDEAIGHYESAVVWALDDAPAHGNLGMFLLRTGHPVRAVAILKEAVRLAPHDVSAALDLAWLLTTHPDPAVRDGAEALRLAGHAGRLIDAENPVLLDILAAAHAESGDFDLAVQTAARAIELTERLGQSAHADVLLGRLELYKARKPYRESP